MCTQDSNTIIICAYVNAGTVPRPYFRVVVCGGELASLRHRRNRRTWHHPRKRKHCGSLEGRVNVSTCWILEERLKPLAPKVSPQNSVDFRNGPREKCSSRFSKLGVRYNNINIWKREYPSPYGARCFRQSWTCHIKYHIFIQESNNRFKFQINVLIVCITLLKCKQPTRLRRNCTTHNFGVFKNPKEISTIITIHLGKRVIYTAHSAKAANGFNNEL